MAEKVVDRPASVRVTIPAKIAGDLGSFQESIVKVAERLGCPKCFSGVNCDFQIERGFIVSNAGNLREAAGNRSIARNFTGGEGQVQVSVGVNVGIDTILESVATIADRLGCLACCSGFDILFQQEARFAIGERGLA